MAASLAGLALLLAATPTSAQDAGRLPDVPSTPSSSPATVFHYTKPAAPPAVLPPAAPPAPATPIRPTAYQAPGFQPQIGAARPRQTEDILEYGIELEPPGPQRLFRLDSEASMQERMRQEARQRPVPDRITFPEEPVLGREPQPRLVFQPITMLVEPNYSCYRRLYFEQPNFERYGWDLGPVSVLLSPAAFFKDLVFLPYHLGTEPCRCYDCNAGYCLPGDPIPLLLYPCELSLTGAVTEAAVVAGLAAIFP